MTVEELARLIASDAAMKRTDEEILRERYLLAKAVVAISEEVHAMRQRIEDDALEAMEEYPE